MMKPIDHLLSARSLLDRLATYPATHAVVGPYWRLMRLDKPIGSLLILWPTLASLWLSSGGTPSLGLIFIFTLGTFLTRSAGCAINDFADRHVDGDVERTKDRPLVKGELTAKNALLCCALACFAAFALVLLTNKLTILLSFVGLALMVIYPFLKRHTHLPQVWLGFAMNWGIVMAASAQANTIAPGIWLLYAGTVCWTVAYDTFYAMVDREDDLRLGVKSIAIFFGEQDKLMAGVLQACALFAFHLAAQRFELGLIYYIVAIGGALVLFAYQQYLIKDYERSHCLKAFLNNGWVAFLLFLGVALHYQFGV